MTRSQICSAVLACSAFLAMSAPLGARACDTLETATLESTCVVSALGGRSGVWFDLETANALRKAHLLVPELQLQVKNYAAIEVSRAKEVSLLREAVALRGGATETLKGVIAGHAKEAREARSDAARAREELNAWYRSPWLWGVTGSVLGGLLTAYLVSL